MILDLIKENYVAVVITMLLIVFVLTNNNFEKRTNYFFLLSALCVLVLIVTEAWEARLALNDVYTPPRILLSAIGYSLRSLIPFLLIMTIKSYAGRQLMLFSLPALLNALVSFSALFCGISFGYTADNQFIRGPLGYLPFITAGVYIVILLALTVRNCRDGGIMEVMIITAIVLLAFLSTVLESIFAIPFIQNPSIATSITFYYLFLHTNRSNRDQLTGALNRRRFYLDAEKHKSTLAAIISLDVNNLKVLNDQYGHLEGDKALVAVTRLIKEHTGTHSALYRTGGDEFIILCYKMDEEAVRRMVGDICSELEQTEYRCAVGYAMYSPGMDFETACQMADNVMYDNKRRMKSEHQPAELLK